MRRNILIGVLFAFFAHPAFAQDAKWEESPQMFLANGGPRGEITYKKGDYILRLPLVWETSARIAASVDFEFGKQRETVGAGSVLPGVLFWERGDRSDPVQLFCTRSRVIEKVKTGGLMAILQSAVQNSLSDSQKCLRDTNSDGAFDQILMVGEGDNDFRAGKAIEPISYEVLKNEPISNTGDDEVTLDLYSLGKANARLWLNIVQAGKKRRFVSVSSGSFTASSSTKIDFAEDINRRLEIFGAVFEVVGFDSEAKTVTIRWPEDVDTNLRVLIPTDMYYRQY